MTKKWEAKEISHDFSLVTTEEYDQLLEEFAKMVYSSFCQLQKDLPKANVITIETIGRTGTNG